MGAYPDLSTTTYRSPRITTSEEYELPVAELREWVLDASVSLADRTIAAAKLEAMGEPQCGDCLGERWGHFGEPTFERDSYGLPIAVNDDGWAPCPTCNASGMADEGEPVVEVPPALLPALCGFGALMMDVAAPREEVAA